MIAKLKGTINELRPTEVILDVMGVGYQCFIPFTTYEKLLNQSEAALNIFTYHKEDQFKLFGFFSSQEKDLFAILIAINGIGPAMALSILSGISIEDLIDTVRSNNAAMLMKIPGVGKSKAEKLIFELSRRLKKIEGFIGDIKKKSSIRSEAVEALVSLGFDENKATKLIDEIIKTDSGITLEPLLKTALKQLSI